MSMPPGLFAQDNFKLRPNLTLEYGLRFEWNGTPTEGANRLVIFNPSSVVSYSNGYERGGRDLSAEL